MIEFHPFFPGDLALVEPQPGQAAEPDILRLVPGLAVDLANSLSFSGWSDGRCIGCAGVVPLHPQRAFVWALLSARAGPHLVQITRFVRIVLDHYPVRRLEVTVLPEFKAARRWVEILGFVEEATLEAYDELGREMIMFKRVKR